METAANTSIKQEIVEKAGTSRKPIELSDEESTDGENSVIILDSDTEADDQGGEDDEDQNDEEEDEEDEDEEEEESDDSSVDSESVNSVWSSVNETVGDQITTEAAEVKITKKFEKAMIRIADNDEESGQRILRKLLDDPIISQFTTESPDFEELEEPPRLARMLQVFIAIHKNLAKLNPSQEVQHLRQVLAYEPNNSSLWLDVALKSIPNDVNFAKYAFKKCENLKESLEAHATLLYVSCDYAACLHILKSYQDEQECLNDKMRYLKFKIRATSQYYKQLSDRIFEEDEVYAEISQLDPRKILVFDERINELIRTIDEKQKELETEFEHEKVLYSTIPVSILADQDLQTVCTLFCDLFDRIHAHSHCRNQLIEFSNWESRKEHLEVRDALQEMLEIVECVEELTEQVEAESKKKKSRKRERKEYLANWRKRLFVEDGVEDTEEEEESQDEQSELTEHKKSPEMPENELAVEFMLYCEEIVPIKGKMRRREKTPPPSQPSQFINPDAILELLEHRLSGSAHSILDILKSTLHVLAEHSPAHGALPEELREVVREMYNRVVLFEHQDAPELDLMLMEIDSFNAKKICIKKYISFLEHDAPNAPNPEEHRLLILRFMWKYANSGLKDEIQLDYLRSLEECLRPEEQISTATGSFAIWDVELTIAELEKKKRIESVKHLWSAHDYKTLVSIIENDIEFGAISDEETLEILGYWLKSLEKLKKHTKLAELATRALHYYLFGEHNDNYDKNKIHRLIEQLLEKLYSIKFKKMSAPICSTLGYLICVAMKKYKELERKWKNWRLLYEMVRMQRSQSCVQYVEQLDRDEDPHAMPLLELDLLVKAHEVLAEHKCCSQDNYEFLLFVVDRFREMIEDIPTLEMIYDNVWLWNNVNNEIAQLLFCMFGKYGRKRKAAEDHENGAKCSASIEIARRVIPIVLVQPLPLYDEKEKLAHDIVELFSSKFPYLLEVSGEKKEKVEGFTRALRASNTLEDVNGGLKKYRDGEEEDGLIRSLIWYAMALSSYRTSANKEAVKYSELYLLTDDSATNDRLRGSVWGILAHQNVLDLFQLEPLKIYEEWRWRIMPFRMAVDAQEHEPVPHFQLATTLYTIGSSLTRFYRQLPENDARKSGGSEIGALRVEAREHFDRSLELTRIGDDGTQPEHQWLCYFFIGKLEAKKGRGHADIVKIVESFYEAACGCELSGFYYPQKVQLKKQTNFEPLEVHYQTFAAVYKSIRTEGAEPEHPEHPENLRKLRVLLKVMNDGHRVVKPNSSLFKVNPDIYGVVDDLIYRCSESSEASKVSEEVSELKKELLEMCSKAFQLVTERFPHIKSFYRLAQIDSDKEHWEKASEHIFKNIFKRKKRDDGLFEQLVEISSNDISRNGSHSFHIERSLRLGLRVAEKLQDLHNVVAVLVTMSGVIGKDNDDHLTEEVWESIIISSLEAMEHIIKSRDLNARNTPSPAPGEPNAPKEPKEHKRKALTTSVIKSELWRLLNVLTKCSKPEEPRIKMMRSKTEEMIVLVFKSLESFRAQMSLPSSAELGKKKNLLLKRKIDTVSGSTISGSISGSAPSSTANILNQWAEQIAKKVASAPKLAPPILKPDAPILKPVALSSSALAAKNIPSTSSSAAFKNNPSTSSLPAYQPLSDSDDDIQCIEPPPKKSTAPALQNAPKPSAPKPTVAPRALGAAGAPKLAPGASGASVRAPGALGAPKSTSGQVPGSSGSLSSSGLTPDAGANVIKALAAGIVSTDPSTRSIALKLMGEMQAAQNQQAQRAREEQAKKEQVKKEQNAKLAQAQMTQMAQIAQAIQMSQLGQLGQLSQSSGLVRPTPIRPAPRAQNAPSSSNAPIAQNAPKLQVRAARNAPSTSNSQRAQNAPNAPRMLGRPPTISSPSRAPRAPIRPTPVRPAPSTSSASTTAQQAAALAALGAPNMLQLLSSFPDPASRDRFIQQVLANHQKRQ